MEPLGVGRRSPERSRCKPGCDHRGSPASHRKNAMVRVHPVRWLAVAVLLAACSSSAGPAQATVRVHTATGPLMLHVRVADTDATRERGLAGVHHLPRDSGMVFVFDRARRPTFWMRDVEIPLSIAFWQRDGEIVAIRDMPLCHAGPCPRYMAPVPVVGAVEVNRGFFRDEGVEVGDRIELHVG
jgi:uncharacterized membrane protein (UPF0127 family)